MWWILGIVVYLVLLGATLLFFAGCGTLNREADEHLARAINAQRNQERRAA